MDALVDPFQFFRFHRVFEFGNLLRVRGRFFLGLGLRLIKPRVLGCDLAGVVSMGEGRGIPGRLDTAPMWVAPCVPQLLAPAAQMETDQGVGHDDHKEHGVQNQGKQQRAAQVVAAFVNPKLVRSAHRVLLTLRAGLGLQRLGNDVQVGEIRLLQRIHHPRERSETYVLVAADKHRLRAGALELIRGRSPPSGEY